MVPELDTLSMDLDMQIKELKRRISFARSDANRVSVSCSWVHGSWGLGVLGLGFWVIETYRVTGF